MNILFLAYGASENFLTNYHKGNMEFVVDFFDDQNNYETIYYILNNNLLNKELNHDFIIFSELVYNKHDLFEMAIKNNIADIFYQSSLIARLCIADKKIDFVESIFKNIENNYNDYANRMRYRALIISYSNFKNTNDNKYLSIFRIVFKYTKKLKYFPEYSVDNSFHDFLDKFKKIEQF